MQTNLCYKICRECTTWEIQVKVEDNTTVDNEDMGYETADKIHLAQVLISCEHGKG